MSDYGDRPLEGWGSVPSGQWHRTVNDKPSLYRQERSLCGLTFRPVDAGWHGLPNYANQSSTCETCAPRVAAISLAESAETQVTPRDGLDPAGLDAAAAALADMANVDGSFREDAEAAVTAYLAAVR